MPAFSDDVPQTDADVFQALEAYPDPCVRQTLRRLYEVYRAQELSVLAAWQALLEAYLTAMQTAHGHAHGTGKRG